MRSFNLEESKSILCEFAKLGLEQQPVNLELAIAFIASQLGSLDRKFYIGEHPDHHFARVIYSPVIKLPSMNEVSSQIPAAYLTATEFYSRTKADLVFQLLTHIRAIKWESKRSVSNE